MKLSTYEHGVGREKLATFAFFFGCFWRGFGRWKWYRKSRKWPKPLFSFFLKMGVLDAFYSKKRKLKSRSTLNVILLDFGFLVPLLCVLGWKPFQAPNWVILVALERFHFLFSKAASLKRIGPWNKDLGAPEVGHFIIFCPRRWFFFPNFAKSIFINPEMLCGCRLF